MDHSTQFLLLFLAIIPFLFAQRLRESTKSGHIMTQSPLQKLKSSVSCGPASEPSHDVPPSGRPDTPPPGPGRGPRPLFSIPIAPPRAYYTRKMDKAVDRLQALKYAEFMDSDSRERAAQGEIDGLTSSSASKYAEPKDSDSKVRSAQTEINRLTASNVLKYAEFRDSDATGRATQNEIDGFTSSSFLNYAEFKDSDSTGKTVQTEIDGFTSSSLLKYAEPRNSDSKEKAAQGEIDGLTSSSTPSSPTIFSVGEKSTSPDDIDAADRVDSADIFEALLIVDEAKPPSLRAKGLSDHDGETVTKESPPNDITRTINNGIGQLTSLYDWAKHHGLKHKNKRVSPRFETFHANNQITPPSCSPQASPNEIHIPYDLTLGILGPPTYKPPNRAIETPAQNDVSTTGKEKATLEPPQKTPTASKPSSAPRKKSLWCHQPPLPLPHSNICTSRLCPVLPPHRLGFYLHKNTKRTRPEIYFGDSNPPPIVWFAVDLMAKGKASWRDEEMIAEFIKLHYFVARDGK